MATHRQVEPKFLAEALFPLHRRAARVAMWNCWDSMQSLLSSDRGQLHDRRKSLPLLREAENTATSFPRSHHHDVV